MCRDCTFGNVSIASTENAAEAAAALTQAAPHAIFIGVFTSMLQTKKYQQPAGKSLGFMQWLLKRSLDPAEVPFGRQSCNQVARQGV